mgnify:CR=1 FL=1
MICSIYEYLYFNLYQWSVKVNGIGYYNNYSASMMMTLILCFNVTTICSILHMFFGLSLPESAVVKVAVVGGVIAMSVANYKYFTHRDRYLMLVQRYNRDGCSAKSATFITCFLVFGSLSLLFLTWFAGLQFF